MNHERMKAPFRSRPLALSMLVGTLWSGTLLAQSTIDIALVPLDNNTLTVELHGAENLPPGALSSLSFTLRYPANGADGPTEALPSGPVPALATLPAAVRSGEWSYTTFLYASNGAGQQAAAIAPGQPVVVARIVVPPGRTCAEFTLVNDGFTREDNRDYYVAVGGVDVTGAIAGAEPTACGPARPMAGKQDNMISGGRDLSFNVYPNPTAEKVVNVSIDHSSDAPVELNLTWLDATGRVIAPGQRVQGGGAVRTLQLERPADHTGVAFLRIRCADHTSVHSIVLQ